MNSTVETQACIKEDLMFQRVYYLLKHVLLEKTSIFPALHTVLSYETCIDNYIFDSAILFHLNTSLKKSSKCLPNFNGPSKFNENFNFLLGNTQVFNYLYITALKIHLCIGDV